MAKRGNKGRGGSGAGRDKEREKSPKREGTGKGLNVNARDFSPVVSNGTLASKSCCEKRDKRVDYRRMSDDDLRISNLGGLQITAPAEEQEAFPSSLLIHCPTQDATHSASTTLTSHSASSMLVTPHSGRAQKTSPDEFSCLLGRYGDHSQHHQTAQYHHHNHQHNNNDHFGSNVVSPAQSPYTSMTFNGSMMPSPKYNIAPPAQNQMQQQQHLESASPLLKSYASMQGQIIPNYRGFDPSASAMMYESPSLSTAATSTEGRSRYTPTAKSVTPTRSHSTAAVESGSSPRRKYMEPIDGFVYQVQFKRAHKNFILSPSAPSNIIPGDFVKVEADRGEDMGIVLSKTPVQNFEEVMPTAGYRGRGFSSGQGERKFVYRLATADERASLVRKVEDEEIALQMIRQKVVEQSLPMKVLDAEYQFDRHKLTFFFEADRRIDFRELVSELFSLYKTRIWMQQVDTTVLGMHDAGTELAKATGFLPAYKETADSRRDVAFDDRQATAQQAWCMALDANDPNGIGFTGYPQQQHHQPVMGPFSSSGGVFAYRSAPTNYL